VPRKSNDPESLKEVHRQLREALKDCHGLLERTEQLIRRMQEGNDHREPH
jgi:hypothetical protein